MRAVLFLLVVFSAVVSASSVNGAIIYSQELLNPRAGLASNDPASVHTNQQLADDFSLATHAEVGVVRWWGLYTDIRGTAYGGGTTQFSIRFFHDVGTGTAPTLIPFYAQDVAATGEATGFITSGDNHMVFAYSAILPFSVALSGGTYWLSVVESSSATSDTWEWVPTALGVGTADDVRRIGDPLSGWLAADPFNTGRHNLSFVLESPVPVPEPSTWLPLATGLIALSSYNWRKRRQVS